MLRLFFSLGLFLLLAFSSSVQAAQRATKLAVLDFGTSQIGKRTADKVRTNLNSIPEIQLLDPDLSATAARGAGYSGSLNMSVAEARDLGAAMDCNFYLLGDAQTLRRSSSQRPVYYESYASIFVISSRTGRLVLWDRISNDSDRPTDSEQKLIETLSASDTTIHLLKAVRKTQIDESNQRSLELQSTAPLIEEAPEDDKIATALGVQLPKPYRRLRPTYPDSAARAEVEATVDVLVDIGADGEVGQIQVARWAGFGLDETTVATVRQLHFFPALRNGTPIPMRVLLRYNFRKPSQ